MKNEETLKRELCQTLIDKGLCSEGDVIKHSYTAQLLNGKKKLVEKSDGIMICLTTRADCVGVCVNDRFKRFENYITWKNKKGEFNTECNRASLENDLSLTIPTTAITKVAISRGENMENLRIRKLTPTECMRLMSFEKKDTESMRQIGMSDGQIYHCAGDSIVSTCLIGIFGEMLGVDTTKVIENYAERLANE